ncbi:cytochrome P450 [Streptomyces fuscichromogenes]|uniref:Cytochrome P450 n=1 Tax=Streptomyces fuscichromogenes TaxID=1324013 RepID=A0A917X9S1_9ACTN|nr:cytochrome P450 [Streptomyces fuscichromogenes]GGM98275.1 cytochrome P450 [Streptomyces fuscichromogenes]
MTAEEDRTGDSRRTGDRISLDRHSTRYRTDFEGLSDEFHAKCPVAWNQEHGGHWFVTGNRQLFDLARRADVLSNDADVRNERRGYDGISIPAIPKERRNGMVGGFIEMDPPAQRHYRNALNPYLSPAAVARWQPVIDEITRACLDEVIETGSIDFVDDLANIVPAVLTMAMLGLPLADWGVYCEPTHASVYTPPGSPDWQRVRDLSVKMAGRLAESLRGIRDNPRPGLVNAVLTADIDGSRPDDGEALGVVQLLIGGGFDTTTALTAHSLEWLAHHPGERDRLSSQWESLRDSATEEFLRYFTPAVGDGRTISQDVEINGTRFGEGERVWLSWAMSNRDASVFDDPHTVRMDRTGNRHASFGLGIHRCIGSNVARATFKTMLRAVLDRMPDFACDPARAVHYDTTGVINGMKHLPATFTPGERLGAGLAETLTKLQRAVDEQRLAEPVTVRRERAVLDD